ncbi:hypothetical protein NDU88_005606 [Pleurodeles waltl]|uniref:Uncharacterized protein n=1 Tax=Pleurodeles waltl TaxID=8319 RepID=A0AAV7NN95_PLEWA|nr:hypothetical protein NDU88_005606 [Pleurodeles waltl]
MCPRGTRTTRTRAGALLGGTPGRGILQDAPGVLPGSFRCVIFPRQPRRTTEQHAHRVGCGYSPNEVDASSEVSLGPPPSQSLGGEAGLEEETPPH